MRTQRLDERQTSMGFLRTATAPGALRSYDRRGSPLPVRTHHLLQTACPASNKTAIHLRSQSFRTFECLKYISLLKKPIKNLAQDGRGFDSSLMDSRITDSVLLQSSRVQHGYPRHPTIRMGSFGQLGSGGCWGTEHRFGRSELRSRVLAGHQPQWSR